MSEEPIRPVFSWPVRVYYEDTDSGGVVYYANYLRFLERARSEWLRALGIGQSRLAREQGLAFAVRELHLDLRAPARLDDLLEVSVEVSEVRRASLIFKQQVHHAGGIVTLCSARVRVACIDSASFKPRPIPEAILAEIKR